ncbi:MAG: hypothetical protein RXN84_05320 [Caldivirga sp.]|jgi:hypothetical protein
MRDNVIINLGDDVAVLTLTYITYALSALHFNQAEYAVSISMAATPIIQRYLIRSGLFSYHGMTRSYTVSMLNLALTWITITVLMAMGLGTQLPILLASPFIALALAIGLVTRTVNTVGQVTPLLLASPLVILVGISQLAVALYSLVPFIMAAALLVVLRDRYGGYIRLSKTAPGVALAQYALYMEFKLLNPHSLAQLELLIIYLIVLLTPFITLGRLGIAWRRYALIILAVVAIASIIFNLVTLACTSLIIIIRLLLFY